MGKYFGTDGFRGEANVNLTVDHAFKIGKFLGYYYGKKESGAKCRIAIGKDTRRSSYMFEYAIAAGITSTGADALLLHVTSTPSVSYVVRTEDLDCGIMISASHNSYIDNGIKILDKNGEKLNDDIIKKIEDYIDGVGEEIPLAKRDDIGRTFDYVQGRNRYIGYLISIPLHSFKGYKVALDLANGSAFQTAKAVFDALGATTLAINNEPNGNNINKNAGSTHIEGLREFVLKEKCDIGFAYDGDADRCLVVDSDGSVVDGDKILYLEAKQMKKEGYLKKDTVVITIMSNIGLIKSLEKIGIKTVVTDVGDKNVQSEITKNDYSLGGEQSGHIIFSRHATTGDGVLTSLKVMDTIIESKMTLKENLKDLVIYPQKLVNVKVTDKHKCMKDENIQKVKKEVEDRLGNDGRLVLRASGTENLVRIMVEAATEEICDKECKLIEDEIIKLGYKAN